MDQPTIHLVGDSILDNYYWLEDKKRDLKFELSMLGYYVYNYAIDNASINNIINGIIPLEKFKSTRTYSYPTDIDNKIYPLKLISQNTGINNNFSFTYGDIIPVSFGSFGGRNKLNNIIVLSIGGNDLGNKLKNIIFGTNYYINSVLTDEFITTYEKIITMLYRCCQKIIIISVYLPFLGDGSSYSSYSMFIKPIMSGWSEFIYKIAKKHNLPVLDLSKSFDPYNRSHYGIDEIHSSNLSNNFISSCISFIHNNYSGHHIYYAPNCDITSLVIE